MDILHLSAECFPIAKVGGLADVVGALPKYQNESGAKAAVAMPFYANRFTENITTQLVFRDSLDLGDASYNFEILSTDTNFGFDLYLVKVDGLLDREEVYGYPDDTERFLSFQIAVLDWLLQVDKKPDLIHFHDHHTGLTAFLMSQAKKYFPLKDIPTVLTIHNAQYQGYFSYDKLHLLPEFDHDHIGLLDWHGDINPLAAAIKCAWKITTVSPSYLEELTQRANSLEPLLAQEQPKSQGILNGIDFKVWNPETDTMIEKNYDINKVQSGKKFNKKKLCKQFNLDPDKPLFAFIGRLVYEKGADLFADIFYKTLLKHDVNILILGSGSMETENQLKTLATTFTGKYNVFIGYHEALAHQIYAGADFLLMPSRVEPCGLNQMYALRYGTIPIVRRVGGLKDTVVDIGEEGGFGICHDQASVEDVVHAMDRAVLFYEDQQAFKKNKKSCMKIDHSWNKSAKEYLSLYKSLIQ